MSLFGIRNQEPPPGSVYLSFDKHRKNFGDIMSPVISRHFSSKKVRRISKRACKRKAHYFMIGSILQRCTTLTTVWGSGLISSTAECKSKPKQVLAVRGPLTRQRLIEQEIPCPEVYGDPALLLPEIHNAPVEQVYELGIVPHFNDKKDGWLKGDILKDNKVLIIDVQNEDPLAVVDKIRACRRIVSSSLHGLIVSDAYGIPSVWVEFTHPFEDGSFKFQDYFHSVGRKVNGPVKIKELSNYNEIETLFEPYSISIDLEPLKQAFPF